MPRSGSGSSWGAPDWPRLAVCPARSRASPIRFCRASGCTFREVPSATTVPSAVAPTRTMGSTCGHTPKTPMPVSPAVASRFRPGPVPTRRRPQTRRTQLQAQRRTTLQEHRRTMATAMRRVTVMRLMAATSSPGTRTIRVRRLRPRSHRWARHRRRRPARHRPLRVRQLLLRARRQRRRRPRWGRSRQPLGPPATGLSGCIRCASLRSPGTHGADTGQAVTTLCPRGAAEPRSVGSQPPVVWDTHAAGSFAITLCHVIPINVRFEVLSAFFAGLSTSRGRGALEALISLDSIFVRAPRKACCSDSSSTSKIKVSHVLDVHRSSLEYHRLPFGGEDGESEAPVRRVGLATNEAPRLEAAYEMRQPRELGACQ